MLGTGGTQWKVSITFDLLDLKNCEILLNLYNFTFSRAWFSGRFSYLTAPAICTGRMGLLILRTLSRLHWIMRSWDIGDEYMNKALSRYDRAFPTKNLLAHMDVTGSPHIGLTVLPNGENGAKSAKRLKFTNHDPTHVVSFCKHARFAATCSDVQHLLKPPKFLEIYGLRNVCNPQVLLKL